ncbi:glycosyltransferase [Pseudovibrio sp. Tun.PSC04-5.I4]|uniref:glycosyltransferase family 2 protein n=1 Tax=Pseudovibrio sp. Tun.PSC04-5.I4 TaxID=1798213 RepID=UPI000B86B765|nr:glycosyltransferase [Pseudovibrio sp. Tun.PSC04-5.I4]
MKNLISYLVTVFNKENELPETLDCLRRQERLGGAQTEFIFVDDCSTDRSVEFLNSEAQRDPRVKVIENDRNFGPSVRINQAATFASGSYFIPLDADDFLPLNSTRVLLDMSGDRAAPLVFGQSKRGYKPSSRILTNAQTTVSNEPLTYCARKQIVHMGFLVEAALWKRAGGADERIFIQDQSLPLRLSANANRLAYIHDVVYWLRPRDGNNLSADTDQQNHDRFLAAYYQLEQQQISQDAKSALTRQIVSSRWKLERDRHRFASFASEPFLRYAANRLLPEVPITDQKLEKYKEQMLTAKKIRRM